MTKELQVTEALAACMKCVINLSMSCEFTASTLIKFKMNEKVPAACYSIIFNTDHQRLQTLNVLVKHVISDTAE